MLPRFPPFLLLAPLAIASCGGTVQPVEGAGGAGGGDNSCVDSEPCYTGPAGTLDVGTCRAGAQVCEADGPVCQGEVTPAYDDCSTPVDEDCDGVVAECAAPVPCSVMVANYENMGKPHVAIDEAGHMFLTGSFSGTLTIGNQTMTAYELDDGSSTDTFVAMFDPTCKPLWAINLNGFMHPNAIAVAEGEIVVVGDWFYVSKFDYLGKELWRKDPGLIYDRAYDVAIDDAGNILVVGVFMGETNLGGDQLHSSGVQDSEAVLVKLDRDGNHILSRAIGGPGDEVFSGVALDPDANLLVTGWFTGVTDLGGGPMVSAGAPNYREVLIAKLDPQGDHLWSTSSFGAGDNLGLDIASDSAGNAYVVGFFHDSVELGGTTLMAAGYADGFAVKLDPAGSPLLSLRFGSNYTDEASGVAAQSDGGFALIGHFSGQIDLGAGPLDPASVSDVLAARFDPAGGVLWNHQFGLVNGGSEGSEIALEPAGTAVMTGLFRYSIDFGTGLLSSISGERATFLARVQP